MRSALVLLLPALTAGVLAGPVGANGLLVAGVSITTPAESLRVREARTRAAEHLTPHATPLRAATISTLATVVPVGVGLSIAGRNGTAGALLVAGGVIVGPAAGYFDSGLDRRGTLGVVLRTATGILALSAVSALIGDDSDLTDFSGPAIVFIGGVSATGLLAIADCALVGPDVARAQRRSWSIGPTAQPGRGARGVGVALRF